MYSDSSRASVRSLLTEAATHYQRAALLEALAGHVRQPDSGLKRQAAASPSVLPDGPPRPQA